MGNKQHHKGNKYHMILLKSDTLSSQIHRTKVKMVVAKGWLRGEWKVII